VADQSLLYLNVSIQSMYSNDIRTDMSDWNKSFTVLNNLEGSINFTVKNKDNAPAPGALIVLYDSSYNKLYEVTTK